MTKHNERPPTLLDELMTFIINDLPTEALVSIADLDKDELRVLELVHGKYIKHRLSQLTEQGRIELLEECRKRSSDKSMDDAGVAVFILRELWKQLA